MVTCWLYLREIYIKLRTTLMIAAEEPKIAYMYWKLIYKLWHMPYDDLKIFLSEYKKAYFQDPNWTFLWMENWRQKKNTLFWYLIPGFYFGTSVCDFHMCLKKIEGLYYTEGIEWDNFYLLELEFLLNLDWAENAITDGYQSVIVFFIVYIVSMFFWVVNETIHEYGPIPLYGFSEYVLDDNELFIDHVGVWFFVTTNPAYAVLFFVLAIPIAVISGACFDLWGPEYEEIEGDLMREEAEAELIGGLFFYEYEYERYSLWGDVYAASTVEKTIIRWDLLHVREFFYEDFYYGEFHDDIYYTLIMDLFDTQLERGLVMKCDLENHLWTHFLTFVDPVERTVNDFEDFNLRLVPEQLNNIPVPTAIKGMHKFEYEYKESKGLALKTVSIKVLKKLVPKWKVWLFFKLIDTERILKLRGPEIWDPKIKKDLINAVQLDTKKAFVTFPTIGLFFNLREFRENITCFSYSKNLDYKKIQNIYQQRKAYTKKYFSYARLFEALKWRFNNISNIRKREKWLKKSKNSAYIWMHYKPNK